MYIASIMFDNLCLANFITITLRQNLRLKLFFEYESISVASVGNPTLMKSRSSFFMIISEICQEPYHPTPHIQGQNMNQDLAKPRIQGELIYTPPPLPPFLAQRHFPGEGGGGVYSEAPRGRNFIRPPPPPFIHPPPLDGYFQGWGGGGV